MMKENLRSIYRNAEDALRNWCDMSRLLNCKPLEDMAKTIESHLPGIISFWRCDKISSAATEGFNNKIRWLIKQAYAYRDK